MKRGASVSNGLAGLAEGLAEFKVSTKDLATEDVEKAFAALNIAPHSKSTTIVSSAATTVAHPVEEFDWLKTIQTSTNIDDAKKYYDMTVALGDPAYWLAFFQNPTLSTFIGPIELQTGLSSIEAYATSNPNHPALAEIGHTMAKNAQWCQWLSYPAFMPYMKVNKKLREYIVSSADFLMHLDHKLISDLVVDFPENASTLLHTLMSILTSKPPTHPQFKLTILALQWIEARAPFAWGNCGIYEKLDIYINQHGNKDVRVFVIPKNHVTTYTPLRAALQSSQDSIDGVTEASVLTPKKGLDKKAISF